MKKGYIAPPILADFNGDKTLDILVNTSEGQIKLIDGNTKKSLWSVVSDSSEIFSQAGVGYFTGYDKILDVFVQSAVGVYPGYEYTRQYLIDGKDGSIKQQFRNTRFTYCSPLVVDMDNDGHDEILLSMVVDSLVNKIDRPFIHLMHYNFKANRQRAFLQKIQGGNFASTPLLTDLDNDNKADLIYAYSPATSSYFPGNTIFEKPKVELHIMRKKIPTLDSKNIKWGNYMGEKCKSKM